MLLFRRTYRFFDSRQRLMLKYSDQPHCRSSAQFPHPSLIHLADVRRRHYHINTAKTSTSSRRHKYFSHHPTFLNFFSLLHQSCVVRCRSRRALCTTCTLHNVHVVLETGKLSLRCAQFSFHLTTSSSPFGNSSSSFIEVDDPFHQSCSL